MSNFRLFCVSAFALLTLSPVALAHEGHGHSPDHGNSLLHYVTEPLHLLQIVTALMLVCAIGGLVARVTRRFARKTSSF